MLIQSAYTGTLKRYCEDKLASLLVVSLSKELNARITSTFEWLDWQVVTGGRLTQRPKRLLPYLLVKVP